MAEKLCELRKKGGGGGRYKETSLWTNSAPTSDFAGQEVTLSDSIDNYKYIKINYAYATSYNTGKCNTSVVFSVDDFKNMTYSTNDRHNIGALSIQNQSNTDYNRILFYVSNTAVRFGTCYQQGTNTASNANSIPLEILGLNELATGRKLDRTLLWTNNSPTTSMSTTSVTLSDDMTKYDYLAIKFRNSTTDATEYEDIMKVNDVISCAMFIGTVSTGYYARRVNQLTDYYTLRITTGMQPGATATSNTACIPTAIYGCKLS